MQSSNEIRLSKRDENHEEIQLLLPWYVNRTLSKGEMQRVASHLLLCADCRIRESELVTLSVQVRSPVVVEAAQQASFQRLLQRIGDDREYLRSRSGFTDQMRELCRKAVLSLGGLTAPRPAMVIASLLLVLTAVPLTVAYKTGLISVSDAYRTLSSGNALQNTGNRDLHVIFADTLNAEQRVSLLAAVHGQIVEGPSERGVYLVRINGQPGNDIAAAIAEMRKNPGVLLAEPAQPPDANAKQRGKS